MIRKFFAFLIGSVCAFFAYCTSTGAYQTTRSLGWALFYGVAAALMFSVMLHGPIVHIWINTSKLRRKRRTPLGHRCQFCAEPPSMPPAGPPPRPKR